MQGSLLAARSAAVIVWGWCTCTAALAEATATAHVGVPTFSYFDLAPSDGVTPLLAWTSDPVGSWSTSDTTAPNAHAYHGAEGGFAPTSTSLIAALGSTGASTGVQGADATASLSGTTTAGVHQDLQSRADPLGSWAFSVTPMTAVTFSLPVRLTAVTTIGSLNGNGEQASAGAGMSVVLDLGHGTWDSHYVSRDVSTGLSIIYPSGLVVTPPRSAWTEGTMTLTLVNGSTTAAQGWLSLQVSALASSVIPMATVPEPPAAALALAGAAALAGMARRRLARR